MDAITKFFADPESMKDFGNILLVIGLIGDIIVLFVPSKRHALEKSLGAIFIVVIIAGVLVDRAAERWLASPRSLTAEQQADIAEKVKAFLGVPYDFAVQPGSEPLALMEQIAAALKVAGWDRKPWEGSPIVFQISGQPSAGMVAFAGLEIQIHDSRSAEWSLPTKALWDALAAAGLKTTARRITDNSELPNAIHIKIGTKP